MTSRSLYVSRLVAESLDHNQRYYEDKGDYEGRDKFRTWWREAVKRIIVLAERGTQVSEMPNTHRRMRFEQAHCYVYYRLNRKGDDVLIYWIKWDGQGKSYRPSGLERIATEAAKERQSR